MAEMEILMEVDSEDPLVLNKNTPEEEKIDEFIPKGREKLSYADIIHEQDTRYENKGGTFTTGIDIFSEEEQKKMEERAKRFGIENGTKPPVENVEDLYSSMGVYDNIDSAKFVRHNTLHMRGTENMSTQDVFNYFKDYLPTSIEWINDVSCNVVWLDKISAARALIHMSKKIISTPKEEDKEMNGDSCEDDKKVESLNNDENSIHISDIKFPVPPGVWRKGVDNPKSSTILLRFATSSDKKQPHSEKLSEYYRKHGNPNFGGMRGILTHSRKRMYKQIKNNMDGSGEEEQDGDDDNGDDGQKRAKNPWGNLSKTWGKNDSIEKDYTKKTRDDLNEMPESNIKERLGFRFQSRDVDLESNNSIEEEWGKRSKVIRMRMHADDEEEKQQKKRLRQLTNKVQEKIYSNDLRSKLGRSNNNRVNHHTNYHNNYQSDPIQVVINNSDGHRKRREEIFEEEEDDGEIEEVAEVFEVKETENQDDEKEEGEWEEPEEEAAEEGEENEDMEPDQSDSDSSSDISEKEVQGPKGSVIKVVTRPKPRIASTVWARLHHDEEKNTSTNRKDLRETLKGNLKSRLGYERSPLRIEVKNDIYSKSDNESE